MARKGNNEKKEIVGINQVTLEGEIKNYWVGKSKKAPDVFSIEVPYGDYGTRVNVKVWKDSDAMKQIEEQNIDERIKVIVTGEIACLKSNDYVPQIFATAVTKSEKDEK